MPLIPKIGDKNCPLIPKQCLVHNSNQHETVEATSNLFHPEKFNKFENQNFCPMEIDYNKFSAYAILGLAMAHSK